jgi:hypothetical protein
VRGYCPGRQEQSGQVKKGIGKNNKKREEKQDKTGIMTSKKLCTS